ncbi:hypothetical protein FOZ62_022456 [Perkinsus olseni]|uniref:Uncharacterized protein n=1 Tax=Perkinsus olseni TaxID=32597 RepID=A0A7J6SXJ3_PEROL|nr:hypothetical protein FOZ62_022456 [Perkinsus olseni]
MASDLIPAILGIVIAAQLILLSFIIYRLQKSRMSSRPPSSTDSGAVHVLHGKTMTYEAKMATHSHDGDPAKCETFPSAIFSLLLRASDPPPSNPVQYVCLRMIFLKWSWSWDVDIFTTTTVYASEYIIFSMSNTSIIVVLVCSPNLSPVGGSTRLQITNAHIAVQVAVLLRTKMTASSRQTRLPLVPAACLTITDDGFLPRT